MIAPVLFFFATGCQACHAKEAGTQRETPMAQTLTPAAKSSFLEKSADLAFSAGGVSYRIRSAAGVVTYTATVGDASISEPLLWAFGSGYTGQTYLFRHDGSFYETAVSYFPEIQGLDWTPGHTARTHRTAEEALGRKLDATEARRCIGCHSTSATWTATNQVKVDPGISCERCHRNAVAHAAAIAKGDRRSAPMAKLGSLGPEDLSEVCSGCHPSWAEIATNGPHGVPNVRHQFYRLAGSRCYSSDDKRISCTACHDAHSHAAQTVASYDSKCLGCHSTGKTCPKAQSDCITCHMPKTEIPGMHYQYTDHRIRVVRAGDPYPD